MQQDNNHMVLTIMAGFDGGLIIYDGSNGGSRLVFGGNIDEASKYLNDRMSKLLSEPAKERPVLTLDDLLKEDGELIAEGIKAHTQLTDDPAKMSPSPALKRAMEAVDRADDGE